MTVYAKIGRDAPEGLPAYGGGVFHYNESTGMEYNMHEVDGRTYLAACHEAVGIVTWFEVYDVDAMWAEIEWEEEDDDEDAFDARAWPEKGVSA